MSEIRRQEIIVFAGPNGSGKSTITNYISFEHTYVNADYIKKSIDNLKELIKLSDICNVYDNSNSSVKRIFKKRKEEYFYNETKYWNKESIKNLTGIKDMNERNLNNF